LFAGAAATCRKKYVQSEAKRSRFCNAPETA